MMYVYRSAWYCSLWVCLPHTTFSYANILPGLIYVVKQMFWGIISTFLFAGIPQFAIISPEERGSSAG